MNGHHSDGNPLLQVERLAVTFLTPRGTVRAVRDASLEVERGELVGIVGESGCGKSTTAFAVMGYLPGTAHQEGRILFDGRDLAGMEAPELRRLRGNRIAMVYQDPALSLNPTMRVGAQIEEVLREHLGAGARPARHRSAELLDSVQLPDPGATAMRYPHQLSGGQQQRVVIAMALACEPDLLIMDEPTTGLDVTTEATILELVQDLKRQINAGIVYVSHNLGVIAAVADRVVVMYAGQTVEEAPVRELFKAPRHPYTAGLLRCIPTPPGEAGPTLRLSSIPGAVFPASEPSPEACLFSSRCPIAEESCRSEAPSMADPGAAQRSRCRRWAEVTPTLWGALNRSWRKRATPGMRC